MTLSRPARPRRDRILAFVTLPHFWPVLIVMLATALFGLLATGGHPGPGRYLLLLAAMLGGQLAIGALNEYRDRALDALSKPRRPLPAGLVTPREALLIVFAGLLVLLVAGSALGSLALLLVALGTGAGLAYDLWLKETRWSWLPYLVGLPLLPTWVWVALNRPEPRLLLLYPLGAPMVLAVHLAQSLPDAESDRAAGVGSLVARLGARHALLLLCLAALVAAGEVATFAFLFRDRAAPALVAAALVVATVVLTLGLRRRMPAVVDAHLFKVMAALAVVLGVGWILAAGL